MNMNLQTFTIPLRNCRELKREKNTGGQRQEYKNAWIIYVCAGNCRVLFCNGRVEMKHDKEHICIYVYIHVCARVCVCLYVSCARALAFLFMKCIYILQATAAHARPPPGLEGVRRPREGSRGSDTNTSLKDYNHRLWSPDAIKPRLNLVYVGRWWLPCLLQLLIAPRTAGAKRLADWMADRLTDWRADWAGTRNWISLSGEREVGGGALRRAGGDVFAGLAWAGRSLREGTCFWPSIKLCP